MGHTSRSMNVSVEQTPKKIEKGVSETILNHSDYITITHLPGSKLKDTVKAAQTLVDRDSVDPARIIPHIGARNITSKKEMTRQCKSMVDMGIKSVLALGGSSGHSDSNPFHEDDDLLRPLREHGIQNVLCGVYPYERSPAYYGFFKLDNRYNGGVSQLCLSPRRLRSYSRTRIGAPSKADIENLYKYMKMCGVGPSLRYPLRDAIGLLYYMSLDGFATTRFVNAMLPTHDKFHIYDFGRIEETLEDLWISTV